MKVEVIHIPYDSGHRGFRAGQGPDYLHTPFVERLTTLGHDVSRQSVEARTFPAAEIGTTFELYRELAIRVRAVVAAEAFPLVLSGNCSCIVGTLGGLGTESLAHLFFDGHGDFNTPETTTSGFLDGMGVAMATGRCWNEMTASIPGFTPLPENRVALVGARDLDPLEESALAASDVSWISSRAIRDHGVTSALAPTLERLRPDARRAYVHFDMDVLDPAIAHANRLSPPDGLTVEEVCEAVRLVRSRLGMAAASFASIEPACDKDGKTLQASVDILEAVVG